VSCSCGDSGIRRESVGKKRNKAACTSREKRRNTASGSRCTGRCSVCAAEVIGGILAMPSAYRKEDFVPCLADAERDGV